MRDGTARPSGLGNLCGVVALCALGALGPFGATGCGGGVTYVAGPGSSPLLYDSAARKKNHEDGAGCLEDLDELASVDPIQAARHQTLRGQCEMLTGQCQAGKARIVKWQIEQGASPPHHATRFAEALASMDCRGGDMTPRDEFLQASYLLGGASYQKQVDAAACRHGTETIRRLSPHVHPLNPDDNNVDGIKKTLWLHSANCFGRAGDCASARQAMRDNYPTTGIPTDSRPSRHRGQWFKGFAT